MLMLNCPSCGAEVSFRSKASVFAVCTFCRSSLVRQDMNLEDIGKMSELQDDMTPLQIGTTGEFEGERFEIIGRVKIGYDEGFWNEWYAMFGDDEPWWLAEAQGFYAICMECKSRWIPAREKVKPGLTVNLEPQGKFQVVDMKEVRCLFSEGELPLYATKGRQSLSVDLSGDKDQMGTIEYSDDTIRAFCGVYQDFDDYKFRNLRSIDGW